MAALLLHGMQANIWDIKKCKLICGTSKKSTPCHPKVLLSSPTWEVFALSFFFGCINVGKLDQCWVFPFHGCRYLGIQYLWVGGRWWEWSESSFWDYISYWDPVEDLFFQLQGVLPLPGFERMGNSHFHSILLYFIGMDNCPVFLKPFTGTHCIFGAFDQEQQSFESRTFFIVGKRAWFTSILCLGSLTCRLRTH